MGEFDTFSVGLIIEWFAVSIILEADDFYFYSIINSSARIVR